MKHVPTSTILSLAALGLAVGAYAGNAGTTAEDQSDARKQVDEAREVVERMKADPEVAHLLEEAKGIFIVTDYAKAAVGVGGEGGEGVALLREDGLMGDDWTGPAFYDFGGASIGAEVGVKTGSVVMLLMTDEAAGKFRTEKDNWSLDAEAGLTIVDYSATAEESAGKGDVVVWSDTRGAFAGADVGISDIRRDNEDNAAFYGEPVDTDEILTGQISDGQADELREALGG